jgi:beta-exotoxin I transport system ATP-binding protein
VSSVNVVNIDRLSLRYGKRLGVDCLDMAIPAGEICGFLGPNGAGKTTTIRVLMGLLRPASGAASILGLDCWRQSPRIKCDVGYLPSDVRLYPWFTGDLALALVAKVRDQNLMLFGRSLMERLRLDPTLPVRKMSRGTRQKLGLVLALAHRPQLLILDEPTEGLDPLVRDELARTLRELTAQGHTVLFSSHMLSEVDLLCDRVVVVREGRTIASEPVEFLRQRAPRTVTLRFADDATAAAITPPPFLHVIERRGNTWHCDLFGASPELVHWAAQQPLQDIAIGPASLESLFRSFYQPRKEPS